MTAYLIGLGFNAVLCALFAGYWYLRIERGHHRRMSESDARAAQEAAGAAGRWAGEHDGARAAECRRKIDGAAANLEEDSHPETVPPGPASAGP